MTVTELSEYFVRILIGAEKNSMHTVACLLDIGAQSMVISKEFVNTDWLSKLCKEVYPSLLSASKDRFKNNATITLHIWVVDLLTTLSFTVVEKLDFDVLLGTAYIDEHIFANVPDEQMVTVQRLRLVAVIKQYDISSIVVFTKQYTQDANIKPHLEITDVECSTM